MARSFSDTITDLMKAAEEKKGSSSGVSINDGVINLIASNSDMSDEDVHRWAEKNGYEKDAVEEAIYALAKKYVNFLQGGKSKGKFDFSKVDQKLLETAIKIELEHTPDRDTATKIVADHVAELGWIYYKTLPSFEAMLVKVSGKKAD